MFLPKQIKPIESVEMHTTLLFGTFSGGGGTLWATCGKNNPMVSIYFYIKPIQIYQRIPFLTTLPIYYLIVPMESIRKTTITLDENTTLLYPFLQDIDGFNLSYWTRQLIYRIHGFYQENDRLPNTGEIFHDRLPEASVSR